MNYKQRLLKSKESYPFQTWITYVRHGLTQYSLQNCNNAQQIIDSLIDELLILGEDSAEDLKIDCIQKAVISLNNLNAELGECFIETGERDDLCLLFINIAKAVHIDLNNYNNQDITFQWREW